MRLYHHKKFLPNKSFFHCESSTTQKRSYNQLTPIIGAFFIHVCYIYLLTLSLESKGYVSPKAFISYLFIKVLIQLRFGIIVYYSTNNVFSEGIVSTLGHSLSYDLCHFIFVIYTIIKKSTGSSHCEASGFSFPYFLILSLSVPDNSGNLATDFLFYRQLANKLIMQSLLSTIIYTCKAYYFSALLIAQIIPRNAATLILECTPTPKMWLLSGFFSSI